jgi:hypothetical protein
MPEMTCYYCHMPKKHWAGNEGRGFEKDGKMYCCQGCAEGLCTCTTDKIGTGSRAEMEREKRAKR